VHSRSFDPLRLCWRRLLLLLLLLLLLGASHRLFASLYRFSSHLRKGSH
jgi:hypothetical protein